MRTILAVVLSVILCTGTVCAMPPDGKVLQEEVESEKKNELELTAQSAVLMEASTGKIIYEKQKEEERPPASVTKVMTMLLILDAVEDGKIKLEDEVTVSEYPVIEKLKSIMLENGALNSIMSGSGPTVFGLFDDREKAQAAMKALDSKELTEQLYLTKFI